MQTFFVSVKNKFQYAYANEFPFRMQNVLECEFYLLEVMVSLQLFATEFVLEVNLTILSCLFGPV